MHVCLKGENAMFHKNAVFKNQVNTTEATLVVLRFNLIQLNST